MNTHWKQMIIITVAMLMVISSTASAQVEENQNDGVSLAALERMPLTRIEQNGDVLLQRNRDDIKRIVGGFAAQGAAFSPEEQLWVGYLAQPHPSVQTMQRYFQDAAQEFDVPVELLQAIGQVESNWAQVGPSIDQGWGVMHLVQNTYADTLGEAAELLGVSQQTLKDDARQNIRGAAALLRQYAGEQSVRSGMENRDHVTTESGDLYRD